jgi:hypothetical protein
MPISAVRVFDPTQIDVLRLWLDARDPAGNGSAVLDRTNLLQWRDKSGLGNHTTTRAGNPVVISDGINGFPAVFLDGSSWFYGPASNTGNTMTGFFVGQYAANSSASGRAVTTGTIGTNDYNTAGSGQLFVNPNSINQMGAYRNGGYLSTTPTSAGTLMIGSAIYNGTTYTISINGISGTPVNNSTSFSFSSYAIGNNTNTAETASWTGFIAEVIIYNSALNAAQIVQVENYLAHKYNLNRSFPSSRAAGLTDLLFRNPTVTTSQFIPFTPLSVANCQLWIDAMDTSKIGLSGNNVTSVTDKSSNAFLFSNATGFTRGVIPFNGSYPSFFNATPMSSQHLGSNISVSFTQPVTYFVVGQKTAINDAVIFDAATGNNRQSIYGANGFLFGGSSPLPSSNIHLNQFINTTVFNSASSFQNVNGTVSQTNANTGSLSLTSMVLANRISITHSWDGHLCEILSYSGVVSASSRATIENYLAQKWGIQYQLPLYRAPTLTTNSCAVWIDSMDGSTLTLSGSTVTSIRDKSPNQYLFSNATGYIWNGSTKFNESYPSFYNGSLSQSANLGSNSSVVIAQPMTIFHVSSKINTTNAAYIFDSATGANRVAILGRELFGGSTTIQPDITLSGRNYQQTAYANSNSSSIFINGTVVLTSSTNIGTNTLITMLLGNKFTLNENWDGHLCELLIFNGIVPLPQREIVEGYLSRKWGIVTNMNPYLVGHQAPDITPAGNQLIVPVSKNTLRLTDYTTNFIPPQISGCVLWLDAADLTPASIVFGSGSNVQMWEDKSGLGYHVIQPIPANQPVVQLNSQNGLPGIWLNTLKAHMYSSASRIPLIRDSTEMTITVVAKFTQANPWNIFLTFWFEYVETFAPSAINSAGRKFHLSFANNGTQGISLNRIQGSSIYSSLAVPINTTAIITFSLSSSSSTIYVNGNSFGITAAALPVSTNNSLLLIGDARNNSAFSSFGIVVYEIAAYNRQLSLSEIQTLESNLAVKWGLVSSLNTTHRHFTLPAGFPLAGIFTTIPRSLRRFVLPLF